MINIITTEIGRPSFLKAKPNMPIYSKLVINNIRIIKMRIIEI